MRFFQYVRTLFANVRNKDSDFLWKDARLLEIKLQISAI